MVCTIPFAVPVAAVPCASLLWPVKLGELPVNSCCRGVERVGYCTVQRYSLGRAVKVFTLFVAGPTIIAVHLKYMYMFSLLSVPFSLGPPCSYSALPFLWHLLM
jgi:hypothetical protein